MAQGAAHMIAMAIASSTRGDSKLSAVEMTITTSASSLPVRDLAAGGVILEAVPANLGMAVEPALRAHLGPGGPDAERDDGE